MSAVPIRPEPDSEMFPDPVPLVAPVELLPFPVDALPGPIAAMVEAVAEATQTDPAMAGTSAITVLAAAACGRVEIDARPGWREVLALYTATVARPGERKSAVQAMMTAPLRQAEEALGEADEDLRREAVVKAQVAAKEADAAEAAVVKGKGSISEAIDKRRIADDAAAAITPAPRLFADDVTPEALSSLLAEHGGRMAVISAEGGIFDIIAGRYSNGVNLDCFLKGHAGDTLRVDRRGRPAEHIARPALTVGLMIQPEVLAAIGKNQQFRGRGLLARFLYARPTSLVGRRIAGASPVPQEIWDGYSAQVGELARRLAAVKTAVIELDQHAHELLIETERHLEPQLGESGVLGSLADWGSKLLGAIVRIAALLHLTELGEEAFIRRVSRDCLERAITIGWYFRAQAIAAFAEMQTDPETEAAIYLQQRLRAHDAEVITFRDMLRLARKFRSAEELRPSVNRLIDHGWLYPLEQQRTGPGRPAEQFRRHPQLISRS